MMTTEEDLKKKPHRLKDLTVTAVSAVDRGANPGAHVVLMKRNGQDVAWTKPEVYARVKKHAISKYPNLTTAAAISRVTLEDPKVSACYKAAKYAPIREDVEVKKARPAERLLQSSTVQDVLAITRRIHKQDGKTLSAVATSELARLAGERREKDPSLSLDEAIATVISEGVKSDDEKVWFLVSTISDRKNALIAVEDARKIDKVRNEFARHGIQL